MSIICNCLKGNGLIVEAQMSTVYVRLKVQSEPYVTICEAKHLVNYFFHLLPV